MLTSAHSNQPDQWAPPELWASVFSILVASRSDLKSLTLTCRTFRWLAQPSLFSRPVLCSDEPFDPEQLDFYTSPRIASAVKSCRLGIKWNRNFDEANLDGMADSLFNTLPHFINITTLVLVGIGFITEQIAAQIFQLEHLEEVELLRCWSHVIQHPRKSVRKFVLSEADQNFDSVSLWLFFIDPSVIQYLSISEKLHWILPSLSTMGTLKRLTILRLCINGAVRPPTNCLDLLGDCPVLEQFFLDGRFENDSIWQCPFGWLLTLRVFRGPGSRLFGTIMHGRPIRHLEVADPSAWDSEHPMASVVSLQGSGSAVESLRLKCHFLKLELLLELSHVFPNLRFLEIAEVLSPTLSDEKLLSAFTNSTPFPLLEYLHIRRGYRPSSHRTVVALKTKLAFSTFQWLRAVAYDNEVWDPSTGDAVADMPTLEQWRDDALS